MNAFSIIIGADLVPTKSNIDLFVDSNIETLIGKELAELLDSAKIRICNLETPLINNTFPISKWGPNLIAPTDTINGIKSLKIDLVTIANNHIMDQGRNGLKSTMDVLDGHHILHIGAGENLSEARKPYVFNDVYGRKIGIYACAEHEFSISTRNECGANPYDCIDSFEDIKLLKKNCDYTIVLYHGGKEFYRYPSPYLQKTCRRFVECGADLVICQHTHCIGCEEKYLGGTIVYGQGNFIFDDMDDEYENNSILVAIDQKLKISYIPLVKKGKGIKLADSDTAHSIMQDFYSRSEEIKTFAVLKKHYDDFSSDMLYRYISSIIESENLIFKVANKICRNRLRKLRIKKGFKKATLLKILNYMECEAHRELIINAIKNAIEKNDRNY